MIDESTVTCPQEPEKPSLEERAEPPVKTPDEIVEEKILSRFTNEGVLSTEGLKSFRNKLANGDLRSADWKLPFENEIEKRKTDGNK